MFPKPKCSRAAVALLGSAIQAFGMANIHACSAVTEGGTLGLTLLMDYWLGMSPAIVSFVLNAACYLLGWRMLGKEFILYSLIASAGFSVFYALCEPFAPAVGFMIASPLAAAVWGALFIGVGAGLCVRIGGAICGDDALAMALSHLTGLRIQWVYLITDFTVLGMSMTYIPLNQLVYSLLTVLLSGQIIGWVQRVHLKIA